MSDELHQGQREGVVRDLASPDEETRRRAVERALSLPPAESAHHLIEALGDASWRVRKTAVERLVSSNESERVIELLISALADGENPGRRNAAVEALVGLGPIVVPKLLDGLKCEDVDVRKLAVDALAALGHESARQALISTLDDSDPNVRAAACDALAVIGGDGVAAELEQRACEEREDQLVRFSALQALVHLDVRLQAAALRPALRDPILRPPAYALLGNSADAEAGDYLLEGLESSSPAAREAAIRALLRMIAREDGRDADAIVERVRAAALKSERLIPEAVERLAEADLVDRLVLIQFLGLISTQECVIPILTAGRDEAIAELARATLESLGSVSETAIDAAWPDLDTELRRDACPVLGVTGGERGIARLLSALEAPDVELRAAAARALGARRCGEALPKLLLLLETAALESDVDARVELGALNDALASLAQARPGEVGQESSVVAALAAMLEGGSEELRLSVATILGRIGRRGDFELVVRLVKDASPRVRRAAVEALARLDPGAPEPLRLALADESALVRGAAARVLGASGNAGVFVDLQRLVHDADESVRAAALNAIANHAAGGGQERRDAAVAHIVPALRAEGFLAMAAVEALSKLGGSNAALAAVQLLDRGEAELVQSAVRCIGTHGDAATLPALLPLVSHASWAVRAEAIQVLADRRVDQAIGHLRRRDETERDPFVRETIVRALESFDGQR